MAAKMEEKRLLDWGEDVDDGSGRRIVILKPMFSREEAEMYEEGDPFYDDLKQEVHDELSSFAPVEKVTPIARHPQGIVCARFKTTEEAEATIAQFKGRYFAGRQIEAYFFDKKSDLKAQCIPSKKGEAPSDTEDFEDFLRHEEQLFAEEKGGNTHEETEERKHARNTSVEEEKDETENKGKKKRKKVEDEGEEEGAGHESDEDKGDEERLDEFGNWLEEQSSDEEFEIRTEQ